MTQAKTNCFKQFDTKIHHSQSSVHRINISLFGLQGLQNGNAKKVKESLFAKHNLLLKHKHNNSTIIKREKLNIVRICPIVS